MKFLNKILLSCIKYFSYGLWGIVRLLILGTLVATVSIVLIVLYYSQELPDHTRLENYNPPGTTRIYAANGQIIEELATEKRIFIPYDVIPPHVIQAFISAEDKNFFQHHGLDYRRIVGALIYNIPAFFNNRRFQGASTITQQVAKNFLLTNERTLERKLQEAIITKRVEKTFSKELIMELYLNHIYLGANAYGIAAASINYFNKSVKNLTNSQAALLAALPKSPSYNNPYRFPERAKNRRAWVLKRMYENGYLSQQELEEAKSEEIILEPPKILSERNHSLYFTEAVQKEFLNLFSSEKISSLKYLADNSHGTPQQKTVNIQKHLYEDGLNIRTTLDTNLQKIAIEALQKGLINHSKRQGYLGPKTHLDLTSSDWKNALQDLKLPAELPSKNYQYAVVTKVLDTEGDLGFFIPAPSIHPSPNTTQFKQGKFLLSDTQWASPPLNNNDQQPRLTSLKQAFHEGDVLLIKTKPLKENIYEIIQEPIAEGAIMVMDPNTGRILAMHGGFSYFKNSFNRATQAYRQPGSSFKTFVYLAALESGLSPTSVVLDAPYEYLKSDGTKWRPKNFSSFFYGPTTLRIGLEHSRNLITVRLGEAVGNKKILDVVQRTKVHKTLPISDLTVSLGSQETTLLNLVTGYAIIANGGLDIAPVFIDRIQNRHGINIYTSAVESCEECTPQKFIPESIRPDLKQNQPRVIDPLIAYQMNYMLRGAIENGTGKRAKVLGFPVAGKTGTSNAAYDAWFIGYTPNITVGIYIGHDFPKSLGYQEGGSSTALPIFVDFMQSIDLPKTPFAVPEGIHFKRINAKTGYVATPNDKQTILEAFLPDQEPLVAPSPENSYFSSPIKNNQEDPFLLFEKQIANQEALIPEPEPSRLPPMEIPEAGGFY